MASFLISGMGIAGLAFSLMLERQGHDTTIVESAN